MTAIPESKRTADAVYEALAAEGEKELPRSHLGASQIGKPCTRQLWYQFRWAHQEKFNGRMRRLFRRGKDEEAKLTADLRAAGFEVMDIDPRTGKQFRFEDLGGHFGAELDAIGRGFPEDASKTPVWHDLEYKTANTKTFKKMAKDGVQKTKPEHYAQMQVGMHLSGDTNQNRITRALYIMVCKETDEIYVERVKYVQAEAKALMERAAGIIYAEEPPPGVSTDPTWFECRYCAFKDICHGDKLPAPTCRSCAHVTAEKDGTWSCAQRGETLSFETQLSGCGEHVYNPHVVTFGTQDTASDKDNWFGYTMTDGRTFKNGSRAADVYTSQELYSLAPGLIGDKTFEALRGQFDAVVEPMPELDPTESGLPFDDDIPF